MRTESGPSDKPDPDEDKGKKEDKSEAPGWTEPENSDFKVAMEELQKETENQKKQRSS